jgi:hypothetical protein
VRFPAPTQFGARLCHDPVVASGDLYSLLGVKADISDDGLWRAYEAEVSRAAKGGYQRRVLELSNALDCLPRGRGHPGALLYPTQALPYKVYSVSGWRSWEPSHGAAREPSSSSRRRGRHSGPRFLTGFIAGVLITCLAVAGVYVSLSKDEQLNGWMPPNPSAVSRVVPPNKAHPQGYYSVVCQPVPGAAGYSFRAKSGQTVTCENGAMPTLTAQ